MPWLSQSWFDKVLSVLQHTESNLSTLQRKVDKMSQATDNLATAVQRAAGVDQQILQQMHDLVAQNAALATQIRQTSDDPQVQSLADQLNANTDQLAAVITTQAQQPAAAPTSSDGTPIQ